VIEKFIDVCASVIKTEATSEENRLTPEQVSGGRAVRADGDAFEGMRSDAAYADSGRRPLVAPP
jgi:hypothetical protein